MKKVFIAMLLATFILSVCAQPKYEFRAVWVATVANIDWPSKPGLTNEQQQQEVIEILDLHQKLGMNAVIFQVRPAADAFYPSELEPWSRYLTGTPGKAPDPFYDPLAFWIEQSHQRGMEFHAWLNPYRVAQNANQPLAGNHIAFEHSEWVLKYGDKLYFDPGLPQTREFVTSVVKDIVSRYDVDAIHFDDYFYPYPLAEEFPDNVSFSRYNRGSCPENKADWRRENVDIIIKMLNDTIKSVKPWVKFGISPFGVWRNSSDDARGSNTKAGTSNYDQLYADVIKWQEKGWIDYLLPQLYWQIGHPTVDFETLAHWWANNAHNRAMYIGHAVYKSEATSPVKEWTRPEELPKQIKLLRSIQGIDGSAFYSSKHFKRDLFGFQDSLINRDYKRQTIVPPMKWLDSIPPMPVSKIKKSGKKVKWKTEDCMDEMNRPAQFVIYGCEKGANFDYENPEFLWQISKDHKIKFKRSNRKKKKYEIRVSVLDRLNNESQLSKAVKIKL